jgi:hypothetical protein
MTTLSASTLIAYHDTTQGGGGGLAGLLVFLGVVATAGWVMFSTLSWRNTMVVAGAAWSAALVVAFVL